MILAIIIGMVFSISNSLYASDLSWTKNSTYTNLISTSDVYRLEVKGRLGLEVNGLVIKPMNKRSSLVTKVYDSKAQAVADAKRLKKQLAKKYPEIKFYLKHLKSAKAYEAEAQVMSFSFGASNESSLSADLSQEGSESEEDTFDYQFTFLNDTLIFQQDDKITDNLSYGKLSGKITTFEDKLSLGLSAESLDISQIDNRHQLFLSNTYYSDKILGLDFRTGVDIVNRSKFDSLSTLNSLNQIDYHFVYSGRTSSILRPTPFVSLKKSWGSFGVNALVLPRQKTPLSPSMSSPFSIVNQEDGEISYVEKNDAMTVLLQNGSARQQKDSQVSYLLGMSYQQSSYDVGVHFFKSYSMTPYLSFAPELVSTLNSTGSISLALASSEYAYELRYASLQGSQADFSASFDDFILKGEVAYITGNKLITDTLEIKESSSLSYTVGTEFHLFDEVRTIVELGQNKYLNENNIETPQILSISSYLVNLQYETSSQSHLWEVLLSGDLSPSGQMSTFRYQYKGNDAYSFKASWSLLSGESKSMYGLYREKDFFLATIEVYL